ncbi:hypothetical protein EIP86_003404 [Pleurotus ostreatoroseus]|nr:hypothetical protein EIP86_003404 [Pleurotus ostreatoroseus]
MGKRKQLPISDEEDEAIATGEESEVEKPVKVKKPKVRSPFPTSSDVFILMRPVQSVATTKKPVFKNDDHDDEEEERPAKKKKPESTSSKKKTSSAEAGSILTDTSGDKFVDLGKKKRATVRVFKNAPLLDIREFYDAQGEERPGKKGISLTPEQWNILKSNMDAIDTLFAKVQKK